MNGAESLIATARANGVEVCFANPGTTEMSLVAALDSVGGIRAILGMFEGVCTGAADGYARMAGRPAMTLLHLGPGFANGIANLHNARRARSPLLNVIGDHATWHLAADAPLTSDIVSLAKPVSAWLRAAQSADSLGTDTADAIAAAGQFPGRIATLIVPADCQWNAPAQPAGARALAPPPAVEDGAVRRTVEALRACKKPALLLGGLALRERGLRAAARVGAALGARLLCETFPARLERGGGMPAVERVPYFPEPALELLGQFDAVILIGAADPVAFFGYPGLPSRLIPESVAVTTLARPDQDAAAAIERLAEELGAPPSVDSAVSPPPSGASGKLTPATVGSVLAASLPEGAIVMDEGVTTGLAFFSLSGGARRHSHLFLTGGAIGQGIPCATGAAIACPDRPVINLQADGSAMYTLQALWTQAREGLNVTTLLCSNHKYRILEVELERAGIREAGPHARALIGLNAPDLNWVSIARGLGVSAVRVESAEALARELARALAEPGPSLIEMMM